MVFYLYYIYILRGNYLELEKFILYLLIGRTKVKKSIYSLISNYEYTTKISGKGSIYKESYNSSRREGYI